MKPQSHFSKHDLLQILESDSKELETQLESHLSLCRQCRESMESLAADASWWDRATTILANNSVDETMTFSSIHLPGERLTEPLNEDQSIGFQVRDLLDPPAHPEMLGRLGHYEIEHEIGRGGMGVVLKAHDTELRRPVAVKVMAPHLASVGAARQRFAREARAAAAILHPNVIAIHAVSQASKTPYLVMPYIVGPSLEQIVRNDGALDEVDLVCFSMQIAAGLAAAHSQGVVHRDIKPANVLIESGMGRVVITDFGLARAECDASMTQTGWFAGTPGFMSPEQSRGAEIDHRSDLFSLGGVMYYMATGRLPFRAEQPMAVMEQIRNHDPAAARQVNPRISKTVSNLIERLLTKNPDLRIQSASDLHATLEQLLAHLHHPDKRKLPVIKSPRHHDVERRAKKWTLAIVLCVLAIAIPVAWNALTQPSHSNSPGGVGENGLVADALPTPSFDDIIIDYDLQKPERFRDEILALGEQIGMLEEHLNTPNPYQRLISDELAEQLPEIAREIEQLNIASDDQ